MTRKPTRGSKLSDHTWKTCLLRRAPLSILHQLGAKVEMTINKHFILLTTDEEVDHFFHHQQKKFRYGSYAKVVAPLTITWTEKQIRIEFRYCVYRANGQEDIWIGLHHHAYLQQLRKQQ